MAMPYRPISGISKAIALKFHRHEMARPAALCRVGRSLEVGRRDHGICRPTGCQVARCPIAGRLGARTRCKILNAVALLLDLSMLSPACPCAPICEDGGRSNKET